MPDREASSQRLTSLDAFRGLAVLVMIVLNNPGDWHNVFGAFRHARWHGATFADVFFPFFLFISGVALAVALDRRKRSQSRGAIWAKVLRRSVLLFLIGLALNGFPDYDLGTLRILGVLQRIALCYLLVATLELTLPPRGQWIVMLALLGGYFAILLALPVPGVGAGVLEPEAHAAGYIDRLVLGSAHIWHREPWADPEGIVTTLTAAWNTFLGLVFGRVILRHPDHRSRLLRWTLLATGLVLAGGLLGLWFPINKRLWSPSFTWLTSGLAGAGLAITYWAIEVRGRRWLFQPLIVLGRNALLLYALSILLARCWGLIPVDLDGRTVTLVQFLNERLFASWLPPKAASSAYGLFQGIPLYVIAWILHRRRVFLRL